MDDPLDHSTPDTYENIVKSLEKTGDPVVNDHDYYTRNSNLREQWKFDQ